MVTAMTKSEAAVNGKKVNICGIPHTIVELPDYYDKLTTELGYIDHSQAQIVINANTPDIVKNGTICHEIIHGILVRIGRPDLSEDETFVTCLGYAVNNCFKIVYEGDNHDEK